MNSISHIDFLNRAITGQRVALRFQVGIASGVVCLGLGVIVLAHLLSGKVLPENLKWLLTLGGTLFSTLSSFPLKDIFSRRDRVAALTFLRQEFERVQGSGMSADSQQVQQLEQRFWQFVDKTLGG
jgi:hypothetical protein